MSVFYAFNSLFVALFYLLFKHSVMEPFSLFLKPFITNVLCSLSDEILTGFSLLPNHM